MASSGGDVDWGGVQKVLISASQSSFKTSDISIIVDCILKSKKELLEHEDKYESFYSCVVSLSTHYITNCAYCLPKSKLSKVVNACHILMNFCLQRMLKYYEFCAVSQRNLMSLIEGLCTGCGQLQRSNIITLTAMLKSSQMPPSSSKSKATDSSALIKVSEMKTQSQTEFLETLMSSFSEITPNSGSISAVRTRTDNIKEEQEVYENVYQPGMNIDSKTFFAARNIDNLHSLGGGDILLDVCLNLSFLLRYIGYYQDAVKGNQFILPGSISEVVSMKNSYQSLLNDMSIVSRVLSLPILEPLTPSHLEKLTTIIMSCLYAAVAAVSSHTILNIASLHQIKGVQVVKDSDHEQHATLIVQKGLAMFSTLSTAIQSSIRAGGHNLQNLNMLGAWCIFRGLEHILNLNATSIPEKKEREGGTSPLPKSEKPTLGKAKETPLRPNSAKGLQGFSSLTVALANKGLSLFKTLMDDLHIESLTQVSQRQSEVAEISIAPQNTASMRVKGILEGADVINFLFGLFIFGYRKACSIVRSKKDQAGTTDDSYSDSNSEINEDYEDEFSSSEDSSEDDDSEPLFGHLFHDNLSPNEDSKEIPPPPPLPRAPGKGEDGKASKSESPNIMDLPDTEEPSVYLRLSTEILQFMTTYLLKSSNEFIQSYYRASVTDVHLMNLAGVIKDLDKEMIKIDNGSAMEEFSSALSRFTHCLLASGLLSNSLQDLLMNHLGVLPTKEGTCMLNIPPRTLSAMAHVLLLRIKVNGDFKVCVSLWDAMLDTLLQKVLSMENIVDSDDVNVEYMQLLLFMFHSLTASVQKRLLMKCADCLVKASKIKSLDEKVSFALVRLVLLFEYFVHSFSKASTALYENIQWNIFTVQSSDPAYMLYQDESGGVAITKVYNPCKEVEDNYRKACSIGAPATDITGTSFKQTFYNLVLSSETGQSPPKTDRKAFQILFDSSFDYSELYSALIRLLGAGSKCQVVQGSKDTRMTYMESSTLHYSFVVCWRLLGNLPPSVGFIKLLESQAKGKEQCMSSMEMQQAIRWIPRLATDVYKVWVKDNLCEQRLPASEVNILLTTITTGCNCVEFEIKMLANFIKEQLADVIPAIEENDIIPLERLPSFRTICIIDALLTKTYITLEDRFAKAMSDTDPHKAMAVAKDLLPLMFQLIASYVTVARTYILYQIVSHEDMKPEQTANEALTFYDTVLRIASGRASKLSNVGSTLILNLPGPVRNVVEKWGTSSITEFPAISSCKNAFAKDLVPSESLLYATQAAHLSTLSNSETTFPIASSLKHALLTMVQFGRELLVWYPDEEENNQLMVQVFFPLLLDGSTEHLADSCSSVLERVLGNQENENYCIKHYFEVLATCHRLITKPVSSQVGLNEATQLECIGYLESLLENTHGKKALEEFYTREPDLIDVLLSARHENLSFEFGTKVLKFFNKLFQLADKPPPDTSLDRLCSYLSSLSQPAYLQAVQTWLRKVIQGDATDKIQENRQLLQCFASYIVKETSPVGESVANSLLEALIPMATDQLSGNGEPAGFSELMVVMITLAGAGSGRGYIALFEASLGWLQQCKKYLDNKDVIEKMNADITETKLSSLMEAANSILQHIANTLGALKQTSDRTSSLPFETESSAQEVDSDWAEDLVPEDDDSGGEDSDEDSLCNKLCTFTITQKEFMNQHWYHCHTCKMVDGVGVCTICAKVCHKGHDLSYAKYGSFFCDCGAKEDGSCQALVKRTPGSGLDSSMSAGCMTSPFALEKNSSDMIHQTVHTVTERVMLHNNTDSDMKAFNEKIKFYQSLGQQIKDIREDIVQCLENSSSANLVLELLQLLRNPISKHSLKTSAIGATKRAQNALQELASAPKTVEHTDHLMMPTLGSQEGAFENVRMNYSGDQGQTIRQLISAHMLRRVAMCCLTSPHGRRQHLAVSHEKGKITVLQLSALLRQADSSKKKLTLTRLSSAPVPFTVLSITGNPCNEDFLAVCGLKDCHVLTFTSSGSVADHLVLQPQLESGNFIIKAIWLPGSQTELAIVTADFVKIYDLSKDATNPCFCFLLPSGKVRDATFVFTEESRTMVLMSSAGYLYAQPMEEISSATHGPFFVTSIMEVAHEDVKETNGNTFGGGVSCYYSHTLQLLFFSYSQGKNFIAAISKDFSQITTPFAVTLKGNGGNKSNPPALCQWSEVVNHPGLICALTQTSSIPVILMVEPERVMVQEVKALPAKAKVQDMVAIRHTSSSDQQRTTLILLCEDGSLRIYMANIDNTSYWLSSKFQTPSAINTLKPYRKKKTTKSGRPTGQISFPVDFFENCQAMNDVEFGGNDLLQVYNVQQVKHRLNTTGTYVASTKPNGFSIQITNNNSSMVMVGVRVHVGTQFIEKAPSYLEVFGRSTQASLLRNRWYDMPFTRDESLTADKKFTLFVGASQDPNNVTMVDSIKVYGKTKESFGWPDDPPEDFPATTPQPPPASAVATPTNDNEVLASPPLPLTPLDKLVASSVEVLDGYVSLVPMVAKESIKQTMLDLATELLIMPTPNCVQQQTKMLLAALLQPNTATYHSHKDEAQLNHVIKCLGTSQETPELDPEGYQSLVVTARTVAAARPVNLVQFANRHHTTSWVEDESPKRTPGSSKKMMTSPMEPLKLSDLNEEENQHFLVKMVDAFWRLHDSKPSLSILAPACLPGLTNIEVTVGALVEIIHAFAANDVNNINLATKLYMKMLMSEDQSVSFACKQALIKVMRPRHRRRRVIIPSPPRCSSPNAGGTGGEDDDGDDKGPPGGGGGEALGEPEAIIEEPEESGFEIVDQEPMVLEPGEIPGAIGANHLNLEALLGGRGGLAPMLDLPPDADDEAMMELAIALSLQEQGGSAAARLNLQGMALSGQGQSSSSLEAGTLSDTTASAAASDDEGSTAATDGSTLRTSPAEQTGSGGSESGGSAADSITGEHSVSSYSAVSGRSSTFGDTIHEGNSNPPESISSVGGQNSNQPDNSDLLESDADATHRMHLLRIMLLDRFLQYLPELRDVGGVRAIPFMQVLLMLSSDLDLEEDKDCGAMDNLLVAMLGELNMSCRDFTNIAERTPHHEVQLIIMRLLSVFMSRSKSGTKTTSSETSALISHTTATAMLSSGAIEYCQHILKALLEHWKQASPDEESGTVVSNLLKPHPVLPPADMSPFFLRQYVKGHAGDVFEAYTQLLTEMVLRLPYQIKKICDSNPSVGHPVFDQAWIFNLCEYMITQQTPFVRRQVRKLLLFICGKKDLYRQLRDLHSLESHMKDIKHICFKHGVDLTKTGAIPASIPYDTLISLIEHLKACQEVATTRTHNWQKFCLRQDNVLSSLLHASFYLDEGVAPTLLHLLTAALCGTKSTSSSSSKHKKEKREEKEKEKAEDSSDEQLKHDDNMCQKLINQFNKSINNQTLAHFIRLFLLESNNTSVRWQAHKLVHHIFKSSSGQLQENLLTLMWDLWPELSTYGRKSAQFVDLLGYFSLKVPYNSAKSKQYVQKATALLKAQNLVLANHPNSNIYNNLAGLVEFDGFYLESDPCLVCNNPEVPFGNIKLSAIKVDSRYTANSQIVKLVSTHTISKVSLRISDLKRTKMVRTINIYYNNRTVQSVVELKNKPTMWYKAKKCTLTAGQTELKVEFPLPIVAANIMIEYLDFYDNLQASAETLQCPRCSASVPANPGVCGNCGENVFQCHKCRAINYDEKDPFLCNACGFCKYAKFDFTLTAKACCAVDPIESEDDRKKSTSTINSLLEKADRVYRQLVSHKPHLETLLVKLNEFGREKQEETSTGTSGGGSTSGNVNRTIQQIAQRYCGDCKSTFEDLSKIIQRVLASRKELVEYDRSQREAAASLSEASPAVTPISTPLASPRPSPSSNMKAVPLPSCRPTEASIGRCYGCAAAATEHCVTLLRALASHSDTRQILVNQGLIIELVEYNLRRGTAVFRSDVRQLLCMLTRDNAGATSQLNAILMDRVQSALQGYRSNPDVAAAVRNEMELLTNTIEHDETCWEQRLKCVMKLFLGSVKITSPVVMENITLPCLKILQHLVKPPPPSCKANKDKTVEQLSSMKPSGSDVYVNTTQWMSTSSPINYAIWRTRVPAKMNADASEKSARAIRGKYLMEKYTKIWKAGVKKSPEMLHLGSSTWLRRVLFSPSSRSARQAACNIVESLCQVSSRCQKMLDLLTSYLDEVGRSGESAAEFLALYQRLIKEPHWKRYLAAKGVLPHIGSLITNEIEQLVALEDTTLSSDLSQGYALKLLTELLSSFIEVDTIKQHYKGKLLGTVLNGYLSLRKLVVQRTKLVDETQQTLLDLLEEMTTGTESETRAFMALCVETVKKYEVQDLRTPVFIFERLCNIIFPEDNDIGEFFMTLEKEPQQEDYLQGRMQGNPYSSNEADLGPLMRDVKNKICRDCELVALLEDDTGMELLVNNKIISLDLPVKEVYKRIWCHENEGEPMRIVYRMRGLLGDATEEFIETLDSSKDEEADDEEIYKMANVMHECEGLEVILSRLASLTDLVRGRQLLTVMLKLFNYCIKVKANRQKLIEPRLQSINIMLAILNRVLFAEQRNSGSGGGAVIAEQVLAIMEIVLQEANNEPVQEAKESVNLTCDKAQLVALLDRVNSSFVRSNANVLQGLMRIIPFLSFGDNDKMATLINHFKPYLNFEKFDEEQAQDHAVHLQSFCVIAAGIESNNNGNNLKDLIIEQEIVKSATDYIINKMPEASNTDSAAWKEFLARPSLPYVLRLLAGLSTGHARTQELVGAECIPGMHRMEQMSSEEGIGTLSENLMEALKKNPNVAKKIEEVRAQTKAEKKRLAMAMRMKQLGALGMSTNERGQVTAKSQLTKQMEELVEETGLTCCICREGYKYQPNKVLVIYTFTKRVPVEEFENKPRKTQGYSTVSHFNIIHYDCHMSAVRLARAREEWESAALQNANTKCNGLLPLWGPNVPESAFANCLARHNTYLQDCTGHREPTQHGTLHDLKLLMLRFAREKSFSDDSGGGGRQSNVHLVPYMIHMALYVINTTRSGTRESKNLSTFLKQGKEKWVESSYEVDGPHYFTLLASMILSQEEWKAERVTCLRRLIITGQARLVSPGGCKTISDKAVKDFSVYKSYIMYWALINCFYTILFKKVTVSSGDNWSSSVADYIRNNDEAVLKAADRLLSTYEDDLLPCESFAEFCEVNGLLGDISNPDAFILETLKSL